MGAKWEVWSWEHVHGGGPTHLEDYAFVLVGCHQSMVGALWAAWRAKRSGAGMVKVEWR